jgi:drug/metabolite transporter (DMT)-like permease
MVVSFIIGIPPLGPDLWSSLGVTVTINVIATILIYESLKSSDLSVSIPMLSFTPVFLITTSFLFLGEIPSMMAAIGIFAVVSGSFILTTSGTERTLRESVTVVVHSPGSRSMLVVAFLFSIALNFDRKVLGSSDPFFAGALTLTCLGIAFFVIMQIRPIPAVIDDMSHVLVDSVTPGIRRRRSFAAVTPYLTIAGLLSVESVTIYSALLFQIVPCVIAVKRLSILFAVMYGILALHEHTPVRRIAGASCMVAGAVLIALYN